MICHRRTFLALAGSVAFAGSAFAATKHEHHDGAQLLGSRINTDGKHEVHRIGDHGVHVHVQNKKIFRVTVEHRTRGDVPVKKYKSSKKMVQGDGLIPVAAETAGDPVQRADYRVAQAVAYVGYSFIDPLTGIEQYYWYPAYMVVDPLTGAVDYVPVV
jgi:hypothetical protein